MASVDKFRLPSLGQRQRRSWRLRPSGIVRSNVGAPETTMDYSVHDVGLEGSLADLRRVVTAALRRRPVTCPIKESSMDGIPAGGNVVDGRLVDAGMITAPAAAQRMEIP